MTRYATTATKTNSDEKRKRQEKSNKTAPAPLHARVPAYSPRTPLFTLGSGSSPRPHERTHARVGSSRPTPTHTIPPHNAEGCMRTLSLRDEPTFAKFVFENLGAGDHKQRLPDAEEHARGDAAEQGLVVYSHARARTRVRSTEEAA